MDADTPKLVVTQAGREAAADIYRRFRYGVPRLRAQICDGSMDSDPIVQVIARIEQAAARRALEMAAEVIEELADSLEAEVQARWGDDERLAHKLDRDMEPVVKARALILAINPSEGTEP